MLENLLNTKLKKKLLNIMFTFPERSFAAAELRQMTDGGIRHITEAMREFVKTQIVNSAAKKKQRYFRINPHFSLFDELRELVGEAGYEGGDEAAKLLADRKSTRLNSSHSSISY